MRHGHVDDLLPQLTCAEMRELCRVEAEQRNKAGADAEPLVAFATSLYWTDLTQDCTADGLAAAFAQFPHLPAIAHWQGALDAVLDGYMHPSSSPHMVPCGTHFPYGCVFSSPAS